MQHLSITLKCFRAFNAGRTGVVGLSNGCQSGQNIAVVAVCIFAMATFVPVIRHVNETARVIGIVECTLVLMRFLMP